MKIGIFAGLERAFPAALMDRLNQVKIAGESHGGRADPDRGGA